MSPKAKKPTGRIKDRVKKPSPPKEIRAKAKDGDKRIGNQFWLFRTKSGPNKIFSDPDILWEECQNYFQWCEDHPLISVEAIKFQGEGSLMPVPKMRAMTIKGLCYYLRISHNAWLDYKNDKDLGRVIHEAEQVIYDQKFSGAAAEMLNPNIIARDLGLAEKKEVNGNLGVDLSVKRELIDRMADATE